MTVQRKLLLAGHPRDTATWCEVKAPWDGRPVARVALAGPEDAAFATIAAARAFRETRRLGGRTRAHLLGGLAGKLREGRERYARLLCDEGGKPRALGRAEVDAAATLLERCAQDAHHVTAEVRASGGRLALSRAMPRGPILGLCSAEQPLASVCALVGPAVAAGCPVAVRPPSGAPSAALELGAALVELGWPEDAVSILPCDDAVAAALVGDLRFATVSLGRDTPPAAWVAARLRRRTVLAEPLAPVTILVELDADLDAAVTAIARGAYAHAGQTRGWAHRVLVHRPVWEEACARMVRAAADTPRGDPARDDTICGPLLSRRALARAEAWLHAAEQLGGERLGGGEREGSVLTPTVLAGDAPFFELLDGAPSAPVVVLEPYPTLDAAIERVNRHPRPGDAALFTRCVAKVWAAFESLEAATLVHDAHPDVLGPTATEPRATFDALLAPRTLRLGDAVPGV